MPVIAWWAVAGALGWMGYNVGKATEETSEALAEGLRFAVPVVAVGAALYLYQKGAR